MNIEYLLLHTEWAIDLDFGIRSLHQVYANSQFLGSDFLDTIKKRKEDANKITMHYSDFAADTFSGVDAISGIDGIAVVQLSGPMILEDDWCYSGIKTLAHTLRTLDSMKSVQGILLEVNSGGGEASAGQLLFSTVKDLKVPVGALVHNAGSGAYMGIAPADFIMTVGEIGSVGSIGALYTVDTEYLRYIKEHFTTIYSDHSPQKNIEMRELMDGVDIGIKQTLNDLALTFQNMVMDERVLTYKRADTLEGGMFSGKEAKKRGLVDHVGSYSSAIKMINKLI